METKVAPLANSKFPGLKPLSTDEACAEYRIFVLHEKALLEKWRNKESQDAEVREMKTTYKIDEWLEKGK